MQFLLHFYVTISSRATQNYETIQIVILSQDFSSKWFKNLPAPKKIWRPREVPNRHFGAKPPLLKTLFKIHSAVPDYDVCVYKVGPVKRKSNSSDNPGEFTI